MVREVYGYGQWCKLKGCSDISIKLRILQIIASIGDGHTGEIPTGALSSIGENNISNHISIEDIVEFPIKCEYFDDGLRVIQCDSKYKEILWYYLYL